MKYFSLIFLFLAFFSCASAPEPEQNTVPSDAPEWITKLPSDAGNYYVGISGSKTGNQASDKESAYRKALNALASSISTEIRSSSEISETESNESSSFNFESNIQTQVSQNLQDVETVDSYYSESTGYWFYLRLSKADWDALVEIRAEELKERVDDMFFDTFRDILSELKTIDRAMGAYNQAFSGKPIKMELFGNRGSVDNILLLRAETLLEEMNIQWDVLPPSFSMGQAVSISGQIVLSGQNGALPSYRNPGPLEIELLDAEEQVLLRFQTEQDGSFDLQYEERNMDGTLMYTLRLASPFQTAGLHTLLNYRYPEVSQQAQVNPLTLGFQLESNWDNYGQYESLFQTLENLSPFTLSSEIQNGDSIKIDVSYRQAPPNEWDLIFSYARCFISRVTPQGETVLWESPELKDAGLTIEQANQKVLDKLVNALKQDSELKDLLGGIEL